MLPVILAWGMHSSMLMIKVEGIMKAALPTPRRNVGPRGKSGARQEKAQMLNAVRPQNISTMKSRQCTGVFAT